MSYREQSTDGVLRAVSRSIRDIIFGLEDGVVSTLGAVTGIAGATLDNRIVLLSGLVLIAVEALSMAAGTYLSAKSEREVQERRIKEELKEIREQPRAERAELVAMYRERGYSSEEISVCVGRVAQDEKLMLEEMMHKELGIVQEALDLPIQNAWWMWFSYMFGGFVPLFVYFVMPVTAALGTSIIVSVGVLFLIGVLKSRFTVVKWYRSGLEMVAVSLAAAVLGYIVGQLVTAYLI